jgi:hypothetical protein
VEDVLLIGVKNVNDKCFKNKVLRKVYGPKEMKWKIQDIP